MTSRWEEYKKKLGDTRPWDMIDPRVERVTEAEGLARFSICEGCDRLIHLTNQCKECGCFMKAKTHLKAATCPLGKW